MNITPVIFSKPDKFQNIVLRLRDWTPKAPGDYNPQYKFTNRKTTEEALAATADERVIFYKSLSDYSQLISDPNYFAALNVVQNYNRNRGNPKPSQNEFNRAMDTLNTIETEKGILGIATRPSR